MSLGLLRPGELIRRRCLVPCDRQRRGIGVRPLLASPSAVAPATEIATDLTGQHGRAAWRGPGPRPAHARASCGPADDRGRPGIPSPLGGGRHDTGGRA